MYRKSYCITSSIDVGHVSFSKMSKILHETFLYDGQGTDRHAVLYADRSCFAIRSCSNWDVTLHVVMHERITGSKQEVTKVVSLCKKRVGKHRFISI